MPSINGAAIVPAGQIHYIDHLAVVSDIFDVPFIAIDDECEALARKYYPPLDVRKCPEQEVTPDFLITSFDALFTSDVWPQEGFQKQFQHLEKNTGKR